MAINSNAPNLIPGDTNGKSDVFVVDRMLGTIERASVGSGEIEGNGASGIVDISANGRYVVFISASTNWDPRDTHPGWDVYLRDRVARTTELISVRISPPSGSTYGSNGPRISPDGRFVAFGHAEDNLVSGDSNGTSDVFLHDRRTGVTELISVDSAGIQSDHQSYAPALSADGRYVAFVSNATNWYPGNPPPPWSKPYVYVRDRSQQTLIPVNLGASGLLGPGNSGEEIDISADGRYLVYLYRWPNTPLRPMWRNELFLRDLVTGRTEPIGYSVFGNNGSVASLYDIHRMTISADGRFVAFESRYDEYVLHSGNTGGINVFVHDNATGLTHAAGLGPSDQWPSLPPQTGAEAFHPAISPDGTAVSFVCEDPSFGSGNAYYNVYLRVCDWAGPQVYCEPRPTSQHCRPSVSFSGVPSAAAGSGFTVEASKLIGAGAGFFFYSTRRAILTPLQGGYLCMEPPIRRLPVQATGGSPPPGCSGSLAVDFNAWIASGVDPALQAGQNVCIQAWSRDAAAPTGGNLTDAVAFLIDP